MKLYIKLQILIAIKRIKIITLIFFVEPMAAVDERLQPLKAFRVDRVHWHGVGFETFLGWELFAAQRTRPGGLFSCSAGAWIATFCIVAPRVWPRRLCFFVTFSCCKSTQIITTLLFFYLLYLFCTHCTAQYFFWLIKNLLIFKALNWWWSLEINYLLTLWTPQFLLRWKLGKCHRFQFEKCCLRLVFEAGEFAPSANASWFAHEPWGRLWSCY